MAVRHRSLRFSLPEALVLASLAAGAYLVFRSTPEIRRSIASEEAALVAVRETAAAEQTFLSRRLRDDDGDKAPEYGDLPDLAKAGLLGRPISSDANGQHCEVDGYRLEVLLPGGHDRAGRVTFARPGKKPMPDLSATLFAVVAIPRRGSASGLRGFYLDAAGRLYETEGVCDVDGEAHQPPPPRVLSDAEEDLGTEGPVWRLRGGPAKLPPR